MEPALAPEAPQGRLSARTVLAVALGNALEFYDFLTFSFFSVQISHAFYPEGQTRNGLLYTLATFGLGFLTRPLGGWVIGRYGDRAGRRAAMTLSFSLMGLALVGVALTPSYAQIGAAAPVLLLLFRLVQGFALGGEIGPTTAFLVEAAPARRRGLYVAMQFATQDVAVLVAGAVGFLLANLLSPADLDAWGWRVALLLGVVIVPFGLWLRRTLPETLVREDHRVDTAPHRPIVRRVVMLGLPMMAAVAIANYVLAYLTTYAQDSLKLPAVLAFAATTFIGAAQAVADVLAGVLADRFGRKPVLLTAMATLALSVVPLFMLLNTVPSLPVMFAAMALMGVLVGLSAGPVLLMITETIPAAVRSGTLATLYAVAVALFGGSAQFVVKWLGQVSGSPLAPAWYMVAALVIGGAAALGVPESAPGRGVPAAAPQRRHALAEGGG